MIPHPKYDKIYEKMSKADWTYQPWQGVVFRYVSSKYSSPSKMMSGMGAFLAGGRWNAPLSYHAVYCSSSPDLANREYFASCRLAGFASETVMPLTGKAVEANFASALDIRSKIVLKLLGVSLLQLQADPWSKLTEANRESLCQCIGRVAFETGCEAIIAPSAHGVTRLDFNLVLILENADKTSGKWKVLGR